MNLVEKSVLAMKKDFICDNCLGRTTAQLLSGFSNEDRGKVIRNFLALMIDSGEKLDLDNSNFYGIKFRNARIEAKKPEKCEMCKNFFLDEIDDIIDKIIVKSKDVAFETFLIGCVPKSEMIKAEEELWSEIGIEFCETIKSEINRELGKRLEKRTGKLFDKKNPDVTFVADLSNNSIKMDIRSMYVYGGYQKLKRGIPQSKWVCLSCGGKGCVKCKGEGKMYKNSVQEIIEKPLLKVAKSKESKFHGSGREDIDARCLDYRPFVIELVKPMVRKMDLKKITAEINKSKKVNVKNLKIADKATINELKFAKIDKTYLADVQFSKPIDKKKLKELKKFVGMAILQQTPRRVVHRRADKTRKRMVKAISWKQTGKKQLELKIRGESGLYIKELINGDEGRTQPNIADMLDNKVKKITLDIIKIHTKWR
jgi:tRNA pseudouridine synthase 10